MKEPSHEEWAGDFLSEAHNALNRAAVDGTLSNDANEARLLIGQALTAAARSAARDDSRGWPSEAVELVKKAQSLRDQEWLPHEVRAWLMCGDTARLLAESGKLRPAFNHRSADAEAALRFFGNVRVAHGGKGHGVPLNQPLMSAEPGVKPGLDASKGDDPGCEASWKQRAEHHARGPWPGSQARVRRPNLDGDGHA